MDVIQLCSRTLRTCPVKLPPLPSIPTHAPACPINPPCRPCCRPLSRRAELEAKLRELAEALAADMAEEGGLSGKTVTLKLKASTFEVGRGGAEGWAHWRPGDRGDC